MSTRLDNNQSPEVTRWRNWYENSLTACSFVVDGDCAFKAFVYGLKAYKYKDLPSDVEYVRDQVAE